MRHIFFACRWRKRLPVRAASVAAIFVLGGAVGAMAQDAAQQGVAIGDASVTSREAAEAQLEARGLLRAVTRIDLATALRARAKEIPFRAGERFAEGDTLIAFDCERYLAEGNAAKAGADAAWIDYKSKKRLLEYGAIGRDEVKLAGALANKASAELAAARSISAECAIVAPFSGRIAALNIELHEYPRQEVPLMSIIDDGSLEIELVVPSLWLRWLAPGRTFSFAVEETGGVIESRVERIGAEVDPVSQTIVVYARAASGKDGILAGMSGTARFHGGS